MSIEPPGYGTITGVILAGGKARRMGGQDKGLIPFSGRPLVEWVIDALRPQVRHLLINANRNHATYAAYGYPVISDRIEGFQGPLAGFLSTMAQVDTPWIITLPCDGPFPAPDLVERLCSALREQHGELAVASDGHRLQPVYALLPVTLASSLQAYLDAGERKIDRWYASHRIATADFSDQSQCFANVNTSEESALLEQEAAP